MKNPSLLKALPVLLLLSPAAGGADTLTLEADRDNTLYEIPSDPTEPQGKPEGQALSNGAGDFFFVGTTQGKGDGFFSIRRGVIHFDVVGELPPGAVVTDVQLDLVLSRTFAGPQPLTLHRALSDWGEGASDAPGNEGRGAPAENGDATWEHTFFPTSFWGTPGGDFATSPSATQTVDDTLGVHTWGSTPEMVADVQLWLDDPSQNFGWVVKGPEGSPGTAKRFNTRENPGEVVGPMLIVTYDAPVPTVPVWGLVLLIATLATASTILVARR